MSRADEKQINLGDALAKELVSLRFADQIKLIELKMSELVLKTGSIPDISDNTPLYQLGEIIARFLLRLNPFLQVQGWGTNLKFGDEILEFKDLPHIYNIFTAVIGTMISLPRIGLLKQLAQYVVFRYRELQKELRRSIDEMNKTRQIKSGGHHQIRYGQIQKELTKSIKKQTISGGHQLSPHSNMLRRRRSAGLDEKVDVSASKHEFLASLQRLQFCEKFIGLITSEIMDRMPALYRLAKVVADLLFQINPLLDTKGGGGGALNSVLNSVISLFRIEDLPLVSKWLFKLIGFATSHYLGIRSGGHAYAATSSHSLDIRSGGHAYVFSRPTIRGGWVRGGGFRK